MRLLDYLLAVWRRELDKKPRPRVLPVVIPIVVHHGTQRWRAPTWFGDLFDPSHRRARELASSVPDFEYRVFDLARTSDELLARSVDAPRGRLVLAALEHAAYEGRRLGRAETLLHLLTLRFEELPDSVTARVQAASFAELDRWAERVLEAETLDDVFA